MLCPQPKFWKLIHTSLNCSSISHLCQVAVIGDSHSPYGRTWPPLAVILTAGIRGFFRFVEPARRFTTRAVRNGAKATVAKAPRKVAGMPKNCLRSEWLLMVFVQGSWISMKITRIIRHLRVHKVDACLLQMYWIIVLYIKWFGEKGAVQTALDWLNNQTSGDSGM